MNDEKKYQLFYLPYSGGKSTSFMQIGNLLSDNVEIYYIEYPGRCSRIKEPYIDNYEDFLSDLTDQIRVRRNRDLPCVLFGYSIGALFAYDLVLKGLVEGKICHMLLGGCCSADIHEKYNTALSSLAESEFWEKVIEMGGVSEELVKRKKFLRFFSKSLRADFRLGEQYKFDGTLPLPECDATILYSDTDTPYVTVEGWKKLFNGKVEFEKYEGNHFFAFENFERTANIINERMHI